MLNAMKMHSSYGSSPLYAQVADALRSRIAKGIWPVGSKIPPLPALAKEFGAALITVRQAIQLLKEGQLVREPVAIKAAERDDTLVIELRYKGLPLFVPNLAAKPEINEETAMSAGLQDVALGVFPDRSSTSVRGAETTIRLSFDM